MEDQLEKLTRQNCILREQLELRRKNADLKTANILAEILNLIERKQTSSTDVRRVDNNAYANKAFTSSDYQTPDTDTPPDSSTEIKTIQTDSVEVNELSFSDNCCSFVIPVCANCTSTAVNEVLEAAPVVKGFGGAPAVQKGFGGAPAVQKGFGGAPALQVQKAYGGGPGVQKGFRDAPSNEEYYCSYRDQCPLLAGKSQSKSATRGPPLRKEDLSTSSPRPEAGSNTAQKSRSTPNDEEPSFLRSIGLSSVRENAGDVIWGKEEAPSSDLSDQLLPISPRLIGEIAFQLDRRLLYYIYNGLRKGSKARRRFYGFSIQNIPQMIEHECRDKDGFLDEQSRLSMNFRYQYIFRRLKVLGYDMQFHPHFTTQLVNAYGLMNMNGRDMGQSLQLQDPEILQTIVAKIAPKEELKDILILLDCLVFLSHDEGKPLFVY